MVIRAQTDGFPIGTVIVKAKTEKAVLVELQSGEGQHWIPLSQVHEDSEIYDSAEPGDQGEMVITQWMAEKLELA